MTGERTWQGLLRPSVRRPTWYAVSSLGLGVVGAVAVVFGLMYSAVFAVFGVGLLVFNSVVAMGDRLTVLESRRAEHLLGVATTLPPSERRADGGRLRRAIVSARQPQTRRRLLAVLLGAVTGLLTALVALGCWYLVGRGLAEIAFVAVWPEALDDAWGGNRVGALVVHVLPGVLAWFAGPALISAASQARARLFRTLVEAPAVA